MQLTENVNNAWKIIGRNKLRSFLTMLGIIIGVMSVIIIISVGAGAQSLILNQIKGMGSDLVGVLPGKASDDGPPASAMGILITSLKYKDVQALVKGYDHIVAGAAYVKGKDTITWGFNKTDTTFVGTNADYINVEDVKMDKGRFFTEADEKSNARVAVLGTKVVEDLFSNTNPIGQKIKIKKTNFTIIGVAEERGVSGFENQDNQIFVPVTTAQKLLLGINYISFARLKIDKAENVNKSMDYMRFRLRELHNIDKPSNDDFSVRSMAQGLEVFTNITNALRIFLASVASIALLVGGIGIMNIMLAAVQERTREIGLRKAVGAKSGHILTQFLVETITITLVGGVIGILLGSLLSVVTAKIAQGLGYDWDLVISISSIGLATLVSVVVGLVFGLVPARRASKLDPITALRYE
jgi:putative ABC transport system permease protein